MFTFFLAVFVIFAHRANVGILCTWKSWNWEENKWNSIVAIPTLLVDNTWKFNCENNICKWDNICKYLHSLVSINYFNKVFTITSKTSIIPSDSKNGFLLLNFLFANQKSFMTNSLWYSWLMNWTCCTFGNDLVNEVY